MDEVHHYNEKVLAEKSTSHYLKLSRPTVSVEFDVSEQFIHIYAIETGKQVEDTDELTAQLE